MYIIKYLLFIVLFGFCLNSNSQEINKLSNTLNSPPEITAIGNKEYCPLSYQNIVDVVTIVDSDDTSTTAIYIQISSGYNSATDQLILQGAHSTISASWDNGSGKLTLQGLTAGMATYTEFENAIKNVVYYNNSPNPSGNRDFSITVGAANYLPSNGHYYEFVPALGITWTAAKAAAESRNYYGLQGYLATLISMEESVLAGKQTSGAGWIGGSDAETEGVWKWVTGPENGTIFWNGLASGSTPNFAFWNTGEPNQYLGANEDYAHITANGVGMNGSWNDLTNTGDPSGDYQPKGYIVEYGGMPGDPVLKISASTKIAIPQITGSTPASRCGIGTVTLQASATNSKVYWYANATSALPLHMGATYSPNLMSTTTFYTSPFDEICNAVRTPVVATIHQIPTISSAISNSRCGTGTVTLSADSNIGTINWYDSPTSSTILYSGSNFTTQVLSATSTYYVEAFNNGCSNGIRVPITATINNPPTVTDEHVSFCETETIMLDATYPNVSYVWNTGDITPQITVDKPGSYSVTLTDLTSLCTSVKKFSVEQINKPIIKEVVVDYNNATIITTENGNFEYAIDFSSFQTSPEFNQLKGGLRTFIVTETNGCGMDQKEVFILIVPRFITPNYDGYNDVFSIEGISHYPKASIQIFDRFGRYLYHQTNNSSAWDGTYLGKPLPSSDYWYSIQLSEDLPSIKGHFALKRN